MPDAIRLEAIHMLLTALLAPNAAHGIRPTPNPVNFVMQVRLRLVRCFCCRGNRSLISERRVLHSFPLGDDVTFREEAALKKLEESPCMIIVCRGMH
jgi:hypothetical protein